jgi:hypothetical protein
MVVPSAARWLGARWLDGSAARRLGGSAARRLDAQRLALTADRYRLTANG